MTAAAQRKHMRGPGYKLAIPIHHPATYPLVLCFLAPTCSIPLALTQLLLPALVKRLHGRCLFTFLRRLEFAAQGLNDTLGSIFQVIMPKCTLNVFFNTLNKGYTKIYQLTVEHIFIVIPIWCHKCRQSSLQTY